MVNITAFRNFSEKFAATLQYWYLALNSSFWVMLSVYLFVVYSNLRYFIIIYIIWIYYDDTKSQSGGRLSSFLRNSFIWRFLRNYYPITLKKLPIVNLDPGKNYLFCVHPHGVIAIGAFCAFSTNSCGVDKIFPNHRTRLITLVSHFRVPFHREVAIFLGMISSQFEIIKEVLSKPCGGNIAVLVPGGASEAYFSQPGKYKILLNNRTGFVKLSLTTGAPLVPVISFGETDIYYQSTGEKLYKAQKCIQDWTGIAPILTVGKHGYFSCLPRKKPLNVVVGQPIEIEKIENPTNEQIRKLHGQFVEAVKDLFESQKYLYLENPNNVFLEIA